jgi:hypothetical protein
MRLQNQKTLIRTEEGRGVKDGVGCDSKDRAVVIESIGDVSEEIDHGILWICEQRLVGFDKERGHNRRKETGLQAIVREYFKTLFLLKFARKSTHENQQILDFIPPSIALLFVLLQKWLKHVFTRISTWRGDGM